MENQAHLTPAVQLKMTQTQARTLHKMMLLQKQMKLFSWSVLFSVSKRHFKRAVQRNRVKRQMREIYRLDIAPALESHLTREHKHLTLALVWLADRHYTTADLSRRMSRLVEKITSPQEAKTDAEATVAER